MTRRDLHRGWKSFLQWGRQNQLPYILGLFVATRVTLTIIGVISRLLIRPLLQQPLTTYSPKLLLDLWGVWDTRWYLDIATNGYSTRPIGPNGESNTTFFPFYPILARVLGWIVRDPYLAGLIISNVCLIVGAVVLYRLASLERGNAVGRNSVKFLFLFPSAFILSGFFSESLFLMLLLLCFFFAKTNRWLTAGIFGFLLALTRPLGILVFIPLGLLYLEKIDWKLRGIRLDVVSLLLIPLGLSAFGLFLFMRTGRFFDFVQVPGAWGRSLTNPFQVLVQGLRMDSIHLVFGAVFAIACLLLLVASFRKLGATYEVLGLLLLLAPLASGMIPLRGTARYALPVFPLYFALAHLGGERKDLEQGLTIALALFQGFLMVFWTNRSLLVI